MWADAQRDGRPAKYRWRPLQNSVKGKSPQKCIDSVPAQEKAKDRATFGWPPVSDIAAVMKPRCKTG